MKTVAASTGLLAPAVIAALVAAGVSLATTWLAGVRDERARRRKMFADAFEAYVAYKEFPYVVRRRRGDQLPEERLRISSELRHLQERLSFYVAWTQLESPAVGSAYRSLVEGLRKVAGVEVARAWTLEPISEDAQMNIGDVDLSELKSLEEAYLDALAKHVASFARFHTWRRSRK